MPDAPLLKLDRVTKSYAALDGGVPVHVLSDVSLQMERGESLAIIGPSGSGKSTLLNIIGTLDRASAGQVLLDGQDLSRLDELQLAIVRNRQIGFIFQSHHLLPQCSVLENVLVPTLASNDPAVRNGAPARATKLLERVGLGLRLSHQRVAHTHPRRKRQRT